MSQREVTDFIVVAPANNAKAIERAEHRLVSFLEGHFPIYNFRIEPYGPLSSDDSFTVIPIMSRMPDVSAAEQSDRIKMLALDPMVIPEICNVLRSFDLAGTSTH